MSAKPPHVKEASPAYLARAGTEEVPPGYKKTEVGVIPEDWQIKSLSELGELRGGNGFPTAFQGHPSGDYPFFKVSDMNNDGNELFMRNANHWISEEVRKKLAATKFSAGSIVFAKIGAAIFLERKRLLAQDSCLDNNMMAFTLREGWSNERFFHYLFLRIELGKLVSTTALPSLSGGEIGALRIPLPPPAEQRAIAEALSDVDALIAALDKLIAKKRAIKQAAMQQLLTGKTRLPGFTGPWETKRLGELGFTYGGLTAKTKRDFGHGDSRYITFMNVLLNTVIDCESFEYVVVRPGESQNLVQKGDVFFNGSSETPEEVGMCAVLTKDVAGVYLNSFCFGFRPSLESAVNGLYLAYYFRSDQGRHLQRSLAQGATRYNLSKSALLKVCFPLPNAEEQTAIAAVLSDMDAEIAALEARRDKVKQIKQGMMQQLLTGRVRLFTSQPTTHVAPPSIALPTSDLRKTPNANKEVNG